MSDAKLRELERRWRETKSVDDEAAYLRERVRVGDLTQERLELAAYCGHEGAKAATSPNQIASHEPRDPWGMEQLAGPHLRAVLRWLAGVPDETVAAVALEVVRDALPIWERREGNAIAHELVRLCTDMLSTPTPAGLRELAARSAHDQEMAEYDIPVPARTVLLAAVEVAQSIANPGQPGHARAAALHAIVARGEDALMPSFPADTDPADAPEAPDLEECLQAVEDSACDLILRLRDDLIRWALGNSVLA